MIQGLEEFKRRILKEKSQDCWVAIEKDDEARIAEWILELDARIEKLEEKNEIVRREA